MNALIADIQSESGGACAGVEKTKKVTAKSIIHHLLPKRTRKTGSNKPPEDLRENSDGGPNKKYFGVYQVGSAHGVMQNQCFFTHN